MKPGDSVGNGGFLKVGEFNPDFCRMVVDDVGLQQLAHDDFFEIISDGLVPDPGRGSPHVLIAVVLIVLIHVGTALFLDPFLIAKHEIRLAHGDGLAAIGGCGSIRVKCLIGSLC